VDWRKEKEEGGFGEMSNSGNLPLIVALIASTLRFATPLIFAALGGVFSERSGVVNVGLEGILIMGAFFAIAGTKATNNPWIGVLCAVIAGVAIAAVHAFLSIHLKADQVISGTAINIFAAAFTSFLIFKLYNLHGQTDGVNPLPYPKYFIVKHFSNPFMVGIGRFLDQLDWFVFLAIILVIVSSFILYKTPLGLRIRSVGEHPKAAETVGISVYKTRYLCVLLSGVFGGLGGAYISLITIKLFREGMVSGKGFIALAAVVFGNWKPYGAMWACFLFGFAEAFQIVAQGFGWKLPTEFYSTIPYILTMLALAGFVGKTQAPAEDGVPYEKGQR
jgi:general nucleoside transport system permease protein